MIIITSISFDCEAKHYKILSFVVFCLSHRAPSNESVSRAGLQYWPADSQNTHGQEAEERRTFAVNYMKEIAHTAILADRKKKKLNEIFPGLLSNMVERALADLTDLDTFMKSGYEEVKSK